jgi:hypothetical protein
LFWRFSRDSAQDSGCEGAIVVCMVQRAEIAPPGAIVNLAAGLMRYAPMDGDSGTLVEFKTFTAGRDLT